MSRLPPIAGGDRRRRLAFLISMALGQGAALVASALAVRDIVGALRDGDGTMPTTALIMLATAGLALAVLRYGEGVLAEKVGQSYVADVRERLFLRLSKAPVHWLAEKRAGALSLRYVGDLSALKGWVGTGIARAVSAAVTLPTAFAVLALLDPYLALAAAVPVAAALILFLALARPLSAAHAELRRQRARMAAAMGERLQQATALRRSGRLRTERRALRDLSERIAAAATVRARLASVIRATPEAVSGLAGAACLWLCLRLGIGVPEAVAAMTTLAMIVRPLRHLADLHDRRTAWQVATQRLLDTLDAPTMKAIARPPRPARAEAPAFEAHDLVIGHKTRLTAKLARGEIRRLVGPPCAGKSRLLMLAAGLEEPDGGRLRVLGHRPTQVAVGELLYLGSAAPTLRGSLRRDVAIGTGRTPPDNEIHKALEVAGLSAMLHRIGGLGGRVSEGRRNLTSTETARLLLARGLLAQPALALVDADEIGFEAEDLDRLVAHLRSSGAAGLITTTRPSRVLADLPILRIESDVHGGHPHKMGNCVDAPGLARKI